MRQREFPPSIRGLERRRPSAASPLRELTFAELDALWDAAKAELGAQNEVGPSAPGAPAPRQAGGSADEVAP